MRGFVRYDWLTRLQRLWIFHHNPMKEICLYLQYPDNKKPLLTTANQKRKINCLAGQTRYSSIFTRPSKFGYYVCKHSFTYMMFNDGPFRLKVWTTVNLITDCTRYWYWYKLRYRLLLCGLLLYYCADCAAYLKNHKTTSQSETCNCSFFLFSFCV